MDISKQKTFVLNIFFINEYFYVKMAVAYILNRPSIIYTTLNIKLKFIVLTIIKYDNYCYVLYHNLYMYNII